MNWWSLGTKNLSFFIIGLYGKISFGIARCNLKFFSSRYRIKNVIFWQTANQILLTNY